MPCDEVAEGVASLDETVGVVDEEDMARGKETKGSESAAPESYVTVIAESASRRLNLMHSIEFDVDGNIPTRIPLKILFHFCTSLFHIPQ